MSHSSQQICRPHFHAPLHPWLSEPKTLAQASSWGFPCPQEPQDKVGQVVQSSHQTGQHLFSFPPTPPKDSTPDSVQTGPTEYQVSVRFRVSVHTSSRLVLFSFIYFFRDFSFVQQFSPAFSVKFCVNIVLTHL